MKQLKQVKNLSNYIVYVKVDNENCTDVKESELYLIQNDLCIWREPLGGKEPQVYILCDDKEDPIAVYVYSTTINPLVHFWVRIPDKQVKNTLDNL